MILRETTKGERESFMEFLGRDEFVKFMIACLASKLSKQISSDDDFRDLIVEMKSNGSFESELCSMVDEFLDFGNLEGVCFLDVYMGRFVSDSMESVNTFGKDHGFPTDPKDLN